jgi:RNA polymerase sigma factor (sigma-70 family)
LEVEKAPVVKASDYKKHTDSELIALCLRGDPLAWEALIRRYRRLIYSVPIRFGFTTPDANDVFQNVCLKLLEHLHEVRIERKIGSWLVTTAIRQCLAVKAMKRRESGNEEEIEEPEDPTANLEEIRILAEELQAMREAIEQLSYRCKSLITLLYLDRRSPTYEEISAELHMPEPSIGPTKLRCLEKLRVLLGRRGINK